MKKLMIAAAVVAMAAVSQAASVTWNQGVGVKQPLDSSKNATARAQGYAFTIDKTAYDTWIAMSYEAAAAEIYATYGNGTAKPSSADYEMSNGTKNAFKADGSSAFTVDGLVKNETKYLAMIFTYDTSSSDPTVTHYMANVASFTVNDSADDGTVFQVATVFGGTSDNLGSQNMTWIAAADVPEPTSGLLLLLGVAGLALRRRRA